MKSNDVIVTILQKEIKIIMKNLSTSKNLEYFCKIYLT